MPMYDLRCPACRLMRTDVFTRVDDTVACFGCGVPMERMWTTPSNVIGDECDETIENNGTPHAIRFRSKSAMRDHMTAHGLSPMVRHLGAPGSDKSPHTSNWGRAIDSVTLANARALVARAARVPGDNDAPGPTLPITHTIRELSTGIRGRYEDA